MTITNTRFMRYCAARWPGLTFEKKGDGYIEITAPWPEEVVDDPDVVEALRRGDKGAADRIRRRKGLLPPSMGERNFTWKAWEEPSTVRPFFASMLQEYPFPEDIKDLLSSMQGNLDARRDPCMMRALTAACDSWKLPYELVKEFAVGEYRVHIPLARTFPENFKMGYAKLERPSAAWHVCHEGHTFPMCGTRFRGSLRYFDVRPDNYSFCSKCQHHRTYEKTIGFYYEGMTKEEENNEGRG